MLIINYELSFKIENQVCYIIDRRHHKIPKIGDVVLVDNTEHTVIEIQQWRQLLGPPLPGNNVGVLTKPGYVSQHTRKPKDE